MKRWIALVFSLAVLGGVFPLLGSCTLQQKFASVLLEPAAPPVDVVRPQRRAPYKLPDPPRRIVQENLRERIDWSAELAKLPVLATGDTDWVKAVSEKMIDPKPGLTASAEEEPVLDLTLELTPADMPDFKATFPHATHTAILACTNCHTGIFEMQAGADPITMDKILAGEFCGRCHGKVAFDPGAACPRCHLSMPQ